MSKAGKKSTQVWWIDCYDIYNNGDRHAYRKPNGDDCICVIEKAAYDKVVEALKDIQDKISGTTMRVPVYEMITKALKEIGELE